VPEFAPLPAMLPNVLVTTFSAWFARPYANTGKKPPPPKPYMPKMEKPMGALPIRRSG